MIERQQENTNDTFHTYNIIDQMVEIPHGQIILRDDRIKQTWEVEIQPFYLCKFPVTQELYSAITGKSSFSFPGDKNPAENVSWNQAIQFCNLLSKKVGLTEYYSINETIVTCNNDSTGYRLPTEAEWQYVCKAGSTEAKYDEIDKIAWYKDNSNGTTHQVGTKQPNAWAGVFMICWVMSGNGAGISMMPKYMVNIELSEVAAGLIQKEDV